MLKLIRENYLDRAEAFASSTGLPPEIIRNFLSDDGKKSPYEIARRISSHFGESPECMCREADVDDFLPLRKKRIAEVFDNLDETPFIVCDTSLEPLGIEKNDMLLLEECDVADIDELIAVKIFGCIVFGYYLEDACDGHVIITFPNKDYAEINTPAFMRKSIVNSLYRVKSYIHYENDDDTEGKEIFLNRHGEQDVIY